MIGETFTRWTVLKRGLDYVYPGSGKKAIRYDCLCVCGQDGLVHKAHLLNGSSMSCGCLNREISTTHGKSKTRAYRSWSGMVRRCDNPGDRDKTYSERGITYQPSWSEFENFLSDMGECPDGFEIERKDSLGNYTKENCTWATELVQSTNRTKFSNNTSGHTGVAWSEQHKKWRVGIYVNKVRYEGGLFVDFAEAVSARKALEVKHLGYLKENME